MSQPTETIESEPSQSIVKVNNLAFVAGSTAENQGYARHYAQQCIQDIDIMIVQGLIDSPAALIQTDIPGFKQIRYEFVQPLGNLSCLKPALNSNGELCLNGLEMKEYHCQNQITHIPSGFASVMAECKTDAMTASVDVKYQYDSLPLANDFFKVLVELSYPQQSLSANLLTRRFNEFSHGYMEAIHHYTLPIIRNEHTEEILEKWNCNEQLFHDLLHMIGPVYGYRLPKKLKRQLQLILNFYKRHKHVSNTLFFKQKIDYLNHCMPKELDFVPAIQIKDFWPDDVQWFLDRLKQNQPRLYEKIIPRASMHLIAKWPRKTLSIDQEIGFRYSFSTLERLLAQERTNNEQILNGIARSIYYRYLKKTVNLIPSYFIKTTILWMCETMSDIINNITGQSTELIAQQLAFEWIKFTSKQLQDGNSPHYFIRDVNLLEPYKPELLNEAYEILQYKVNLEEIVEIEFMKIRQKMVEDMNRTTEEYLRQIKVNHFIEVLNDYNEMKHLWLSTTDDSNSDDNTVQSSLSILNILAYLDNDENNWIKFGKLIIKNEEDNEEEQKEPPIWGENVTSWSPLEFAEYIPTLVYLLKSSYEHITSDDFNDGRCHKYNSFDIESFQNVLNDLSKPATMVHTLLATYGPLCTGSTFGINQNCMEQVLSSFFRRNLVQDQGIGPQLSLQMQNVSSDINQNNNSNFNCESHDQQSTMRNHHQDKCPRCFSDYVMDFLQRAPSQDMTFGKYIDNEQKRIDEKKEQAQLEEDILAHIVQKSFGKQDAKQHFLPSNNEEVDYLQHSSNDDLIISTEEQERKEEKSNLLIIQSNNGTKPLLDSQQDFQQRSVSYNKKQVSFNDIFNHTVTIDYASVSSMENRNDEFGSCTIQTHQSTKTNNQQIILSDGITVSKQNSIEKQNEQIQINNDELMAKALQLTFEQQHDDYLLACALQNFETE